MFGIFNKLLVFDFRRYVGDIFLAFLFGSKLWLSYMSFITGFMSGAYYLVTSSLAGRDTLLLSTDC